jgi:hypothetical protein
VAALEDEVEEGQPARNKLVVHALGLAQRDEHVHVSEASRTRSDDPGEKECGALGEQELRANGLRHLVQIAGDRKNLEVSPDRSPPLRLQRISR